MKRTMRILLVVLAAGLLIAAAGCTVRPGVALTPGYRAYYGYTEEAAELTEQQKADLDESFEQMMELRRETIQKMVENGLLTEEEGRQALERLDETADAHGEDGEFYFYGGMGGCFGEFGAADDDAYYGRGMMRGYDGRYWD